MQRLAQASNDFLLAFLKALEDGLTLDFNLLSQRLD